MSSHHENSTMEIKDLQVAFEISQQLAKILMLLYEEKVVTSKQIENDVRLSRDGKIAMHRLRRRLEPYKVVITSQRDVGYWLDAENKDRVKELSSSNQMSFAFGVRQGAAADAA